MKNIIKKNNFQPKLYNLNGGAKLLSRMFGSCGSKPKCNLPQGQLSTPTGPLHLPQFYQDEPFGEQLETDQGYHLLENMYNYDLRCDETILYSEDTLIFEFSGLLTDFKQNHEDISTLSEEFFESIKSVNNLSFYLKIKFNDFEQDTFNLNITDNEQDIYHGYNSFNDERFSLDYLLPNKKNNEKYLYVLARLLYVIFLKSNIKKYDDDNEYSNVELDVDWYLNNIYNLTILLFCFNSNLINFFYRLYHDKEDYDKITFIEQVLIKNIETILYKYIELYLEEKVAQAQLQAQAARVAAQAELAAQAQAQPQQQGKSSSPIKLPMDLNTSDLSQLQSIIKIYRHKLDALEIYLENTNTVIQSLTDSIDTNKSYLLENISTTLAKLTKLKYEKESELENLKQSEFNELMTNNHIKSYKDNLSYIAGEKILKVIYSYQEFKLDIMIIKDSNFIEQLKKSQFLLEYLKKKLVEIIFQKLQLPYEFFNEAEGKYDLEELDYSEEQLLQSEHINYDEGENIFFVIKKD